MMALFQNISEHNYNSFTSTLSIGMSMSTV